MKFLLTAILSLALVSCGDDSAEKKNDAPRRNGDGASFELNGLAGHTYQTDCEGFDDSQRSEQDTAVFQADAFEWTWSNFDGLVCDARQKRTTYVYNLVNVVKEPTSDLSGWDSYSYEYASLTATAHQQAIVDKFNAVQVYGYSDWVLDQPKDIAGRQYDAETKAKAKKGAVYTATVKVEGDLFSMASYKDGKASADDVLVYKKLP
jgi:hypothetical protein